MGDDDQPTPGLDNFLSGKGSVQLARQGLSPLAKLIIGLVGVSFLAALATSASGPGPQPASTTNKGNDPLSRCSQFLGALELKGVNVEQAFGAPSSMMGRVEWCRAHSDQFQGK